VAYPGYTLMASGGVPPLSWSQSGPMPSGLTLSTSGQLTGTPATAGSYPVMVTVTDSSMPPLTVQMPVTLVIYDSQIVIAAAPAPPPGTVTYVYRNRRQQLPAGGAATARSAARRPKWGPLLSR